MSESPFEIDTNGYYIFFERKKKNDASILISYLKINRANELCPYLGYIFYNIFTNVRAIFPEQITRIFYFTNTLNK